jgi:hypothetical protein
MEPVLLTYPLSAIHDFVSDASEWIIVMAVLIGGVIWLAKSTFKRHDVILDYIKSIEGKIVEKQWYTRRKHLKDPGETFYVIKYYDKGNRLHQLQLRVEDDTDIIIEQDKIIG